MMACAVISTLASLAVPKLTQLVIDNVIRAKREELLGMYTGLVLLSFFLRDALNVLRLQLNNRLSSG